MKNICFASFKRWNQYEFHEDTCQHYETGINLARKVDLHSYRAMTLQFPRTTQLILSEGNITRNPSFILDLTHVFSPTQLTELVV
jgi:hypothetical protein